MQYVIDLTEQQLDKLQKAFEIMDWQKQLIPLEQLEHFYSEEQVQAISKPEKSMTVKDMITELMNYDMKEEVAVSLDNKQKVSMEISIKNWNGMPEIHFVDWRKKGKK